MLFAVHFCSGVLYSVNGNKLDDVTSGLSPLLVGLKLDVAEENGAFPEDSTANHYWDGGFTYLASKNLQFDVYGGTSISKGQDILLGMGLSYRIKNTKN